jgi:hypothetical protein
MGITALLALAGSASCSASAELAAVALGGVQFAVPAGRVAEAGDDFVRVRPAQNLRAVDDIVIWTGAPPPLPEGAATEAQRPAPHTLVVVEGGMGGPEYTLSIPKQLGQRVVTIRAFIQSEAGPPAFADAWAVWRSLAVAPGDASTGRQTT